MEIGLWIAPLAAELNEGKGLKQSKTSGLWMARRSASDANLKSTLPGQFCTSRGLQKAEYKVQSKVKERFRILLCGWGAENLEIGRAHV